MNIHLKSKAVLPLAPVAALLLAACGGGVTGSPESTTIAYLKAGASGDVEKTCSLTVAEDSDPPVPAVSLGECSSDTRMNVVFLEREVPADAEITINAEPEIDGDTAGIRRENILINGEPLMKTGSIDLVYTSSGWLVAD